MAKRRISLARPGEILPEELREPLADTPAAIGTLAAAA